MTKIKVGWLKTAINAFRKAKLLGKPIKKCNLSTKGNWNYFKKQKSIHPLNKYKEKYKHKKTKNKPHKFKSFHSLRNHKFTWCDVCGGWRRDVRRWGAASKSIICIISVRQALHSDLRVEHPNGSGITVLRLKNSVGRQSLILRGNVRPPFCAFHLM